MRSGLRLAGNVAVGLSAISTSQPSATALRLLFGDILGHGHKRLSCGWGLQVGGCGAAAGEIAGRDTGGRGIWIKISRA